MFSPLCPYTTLQSFFNAYHDGHAGVRFYAPVGVVSQARADEVFKQRTYACWVRGSHSNRNVRYASAVDIVSWPTQPLPNWYPYQCSECGLHSFYGDLLTMHNHLCYGCSTATHALDFSTTPWWVGRFRRLHPDGVVNGVSFMEAVDALVVMQALGGSASVGASLVATVRDIGVFAHHTYE